MELYYPCTWLSFVNQKNEKIRNWSLLMKIISTVPKLLFFKTTDLCIVYLFCDYADISKTSSTYDKWNFHFARNYSNMPLTFDSITFHSNLFISVSVLCEFAMLPDVYILLSPQEEEEHSFSWGNRCTHLAVHSSKRVKEIRNSFKKWPLNP